MPTRPEPEAEELPDLDEDQDQVLDLPPPDDDANDDVEPQHADDELEAPEEGGLDDATASDLDVGTDEIDTTEEIGNEEDREVDVGPLDEDILVDEEPEAGPEIEAAADEEGLDLDEGAGEDDGGAEGTSEDPGDEIDEAAYPDLDDDGRGEDDDALADELLAEADAAIPWAEERWAPLEGAGAELPCRAVVAAGGRVAAAGEVLLLIEEGARAARRLAFGEGSVAVALGDDAILAATARGQLLVASGHAEALSLGSWRAGVGPSLGLRRTDAGAPAVELCATPGRFWIRAGGALLCCASPANPPAAVRERGVVAIAGAAGALVAVTWGAEGPLLERFRSDDEGWAETALSGEARGLVDGDAGAVLLAATAAGRAIALSDGQRVAVSRDGGATFTVAEVGSVAAIAFAGEGEEAPLLALVAPAGAPAFVVELDAEGVAADRALGAGARRVGELAHAVEAAPASMAWDAVRGVVWVASAGGLVALGRPRQH